MTASERLAEIEARVEAATAGEWVEDGTIFGPDGEECDARTADYEDWVTFKTRRAQADRELWIEARSDIPWLLEDNKRLREALAIEELERGDFEASQAALLRFRQDAIALLSRAGCFLPHGGQPRREIERFIDQALADSGEASGEAAESSP